MCIPELFTWLFTFSHTEIAGSALITSLGIFFPLSGTGLSNRITVNFEVLKSYLERYLSIDDKDVLK